MVSKHVKVFLNFIIVMVTVVEFNFVLFDQYYRLESLNSKVLHSINDLSGEHSYSTFLSPDSSLESIESAGRKCAQFFTHSRIILKSLTLDNSQVTNKLNATSSFYISLNSFKQQQGFYFINLRKLLI